MKKDLIILAADKDAKVVLDGILLCYNELKIREVDYDIFSKGHDPWVYKRAQDFLRPFLNQYKYALVFLDKEGSGQEEEQKKKKEKKKQQKKKKTASEIENDIKRRLRINGWDEDNAEVIVFDPELEIWAWTPYLANFLKWQSYSKLKDFITEKGFWYGDTPKP